MEASILSKVVLPLALFIIMLGMGLSLSINDFKQVGKSPKAVTIGLICQMIMLPLIGFFLAIGFGLSPTLAIGIFILCLCPGGVTSNLFCYLSRGNVALSISLTAIVSLITPFTIPIIAAIGMTYFLEGGRTIELPLVKTITTLIAITLIPVGLGMTIRKKWHNLAQKAEKPVKILSMAFLFIIIAGIAQQNWDNIPSFFAQIGMAAFILNVVTMLLGYFIPSLLGLETKDCVSIGVEVGIQNGTTALFITSTLLEDPVMSIPAATYSLIMFATGAAYAYFWQKKIT